MREQAMRDEGIWSISLGMWGGVRVRLHGLFFLFVAFTAYLAWLYHHPLGRPAVPGAEMDSSLTWLVVTSLVILYVGVLAHELGHVFTTLRVGGQVDEVVLGPWGGIGAVRLPADPRAEFAAWIAGPIVNFLIAWALCFPVLLVHAVPVAGLLSPLTPEGLAGGLGPELARIEWLTVVKLTFWINWLLFLVNLIPVFPFDGGKIVQACMLWFWPELNRRWTAIVVSRFARLGAVLMLVAAWLARDEQSAGPIPAWLALCTLAGLIFFSARRQELAVLAEEENEPLSNRFDDSHEFDDFDALDDDDLEDEPEPPLERWSQRRRASQLQRQREIEAEDDRRVDEVLARLHEVGLANLADADRELLKRVSERYRLRQNRPT